MAFINKSNIEKIYPSKRRILENLKKNQISTGDVAIFHNLDDPSYIGLIIRMDSLDASKLKNIFNINFRANRKNSDEDGIILFPEEIHSMNLWSQLHLDDFRDNLTFTGHHSYNITGIMKNVIDKRQVYDAEKVRTTINKLIKERI